MVRAGPEGGTAPALMAGVPEIAPAPHRPRALPGASPFEGSNALTQAQHLQALDLQAPWMRRSLPRWAERFRTDQCLSCRSQRQALVSICEDQTRCTHRHHFRRRQETQGSRVHRSSSRWSPQPPLPLKAEVIGWNLKRALSSVAEGEKLNISSRQLHAPEGRCVPGRTGVLASW